MQSSLSTSEYELRAAISCFFNNNLIAAGNKIPGIYEFAQNEMQNALRNLDFPRFSYESWRQYQRYLIQDAALCFYLANCNDVAKEKKVFPAWPKIQSAVRCNNNEYKQGEGIGTILKCVTPLDVAL